MIYAILLILLALTGSPEEAVCDPALARLFAPPRPVLGRYEVCTIARPLEEPPADGFTYAAVEQLEALDIFGSAGSYDRAKLAQLYNGRRARVLRGWKRTADAFESITRISPYPDASLSRLQNGTMIIRFRLD
jgi:hypothetical protein